MVGLIVTEGYTNGVYCERIIPWEAASDPHTSSKDLELLAHRGPHDIRRAVVMNPNTPRELLFQLATAYPKPFLMNPILPLLLLEDPTLYEAFSLADIERFTAFPQCPDLWRQRFLAMTYEGMRTLLRAWIGTPEERVNKPKYAAGQVHYYSQCEDCIYPRTKTKERAVAGDGWKQMLAVLTRPDLITFFSQGHVVEYQEGVRFAADRVTDVLDRLKAEGVYQEVFA